MDVIDTNSTCARAAAVLIAVHDSQLDACTPCDELSLRELIAHGGGLGVVHGGDLAVAIGGGFEVDDEVALAVHDQLAGFAAAGPVGGLFDSAVEIEPVATVSSARWRLLVAVRNG